MINPFSNYRILQAGRIIRDNVRPNTSRENLCTLLSTLTPLTIICSEEAATTASIHSQVIKRLQAKPGTLEILRAIGYEPNANGEYVYGRASAHKEIEDRATAVQEFRQFCKDIKKARDGLLPGFQDFIERPGTPVLVRHRYDAEELGDPRQGSPRQERRSNPLPAEHPLPPPPNNQPQANHQFGFPRLPNANAVREGNEKTIGRIRDLKQSLVTRHDFTPSASFIRRKLALLLLQQLYPESVEFDIDVIESILDQRIHALKVRDTAEATVSREDQIYVECLIRANFNIDEASQILREKRPNLKPPPEPVGLRRPTTTTLENSEDTLRHYWTALRDYREGDGAIQMLVHAGDEWKNTMHLLPAIVTLRRHYDNSIAGEAVALKIYRLLYSELSHIIPPQSSLKIELLAYVLREIEVETLEYADISDINHILRSCADNQIDETFPATARHALSQECILCLVNYPRSRMESMDSCPHTCCTNCAKGYYRNTIPKLQSVEALNLLTCYEAHALPTNNDDRIRFFQFLEFKFNRWFPTERLLLDTYHENLFLVNRDSSLKKCGNTNCTGFFDTNDNNRPGSSRCPHCEFAQCRSCCRKWLGEHMQMSCDAYATWLRNNDPDDPDVQLERYLRTAGMACPNPECPAIFEYQAGGCEHFTCNECRTEFCRICSALFHNPKKGTLCPRPGCGLRNTMHAHCAMNCYREIRDADTEQILELLDEHNIDITEEFRSKPVATTVKCPVEDCTHAAAAAHENRFCETCYKQFLCLFVWRHQIEPWTLYQDQQLTAKLNNAGVAVPNNSTREALIAMAQNHLRQFLGQPRELPRLRR